MSSEQANAVERELNNGSGAMWRKRRREPEPRVMVDIDGQIYWMTRDAAAAIRNHLRKARPRARHVRALPPVLPATRGGAAELRGLEPSAGQLGFESKCLGEFSGSQHND